MKGWKKMKKRIMKAVALFSLAMMIITFSASASAETNLASTYTTPASYERDEYNLYTSYGHFTVPGGTVIGKNVSSTSSSTLKATYTRAAQAALTTIHNNPHLSGFDCDPNGVDGLFGDNTRNAVISFQTTIRAYLDSNVSVDGDVGSQTWYWLEWATI